MAAGRRAITPALLAVAAVCGSSAQTPRTHRLEASPSAPANAMKPASICKAVREEDRACPRTSSTANDRLVARNMPYKPVKS